MDNKNFSAKLGRELREARERRGLTQSALARKTNIDRSTISKIETGMKSPTLEEVEVLLKALNVSMIINKKEVEKND